MKYSLEISPCVHSNRWVCTIAHEWKELWEEKMLKTSVHIEKIVKESWTQNKTKLRGIFFEVALVV